MTRFGLQQKQVAATNHCCWPYPSIEEVDIYGSWAAGRHQLGSDINLTTIGPLTDQ